MFEKKKSYYLLLILLVFIVGIVYTLLEKSNEKIIISDSNTTTQTAEDQGTVDPLHKSKTIYVQVCGSIKTPGVYEVSDGTRVFEVVELAGGLTEEAATNAVNQARVVQDEEKIYFPTKKEVEEGKYIVEDSQYQQLININHASKEQLMEIPGIGESKASSIIRYREQHNGFNQIEDIMNVEGIKEGMFEKIKEYITI